MNYLLEWFQFPYLEPVIISPGELKLLPVEMTTWATHIQKELKIYDDMMVLAYDPLDLNTDDLCGFG